MVASKKVSQKTRKSVDTGYKLWYVCVVKDTKEGGVQMDKFKLQYEMKRAGVSVDKLCAHIKISRAAFYRKLNGTSAFTLSEIQDIVSFLFLASPMGIFFAEKVS